MRLNEIKKKFFAYRNGVTADVLRRSGMPYQRIYGVDVPSLSRIAAEIGYNSELADSLWEDRDVRESRLLATYLYDPAKVEIEKAVKLCNDVRTREEADMLGFRLLRHLPYLDVLKKRVKGTDTKGISFSIFNPGP